MDPSEQLPRAVGLLPVRCGLCGLPLGSALSAAARWHAALAPTEDLRTVLVRCGLGSERLCCRDCVLSRPATLRALALCLDMRVLPVQHPSPVVRAWLRDVGPYAFFGRALDELLAVVIGRETVVCRPQLKVRAVPRCASSPSCTRGGTLSILLLGDLEIETLDGGGGIYTQRQTGVRLGRVPVPSSRGPLVVNGRARAPAMHATAKRNQVVAIATEKFRGSWKCRSVRVVTLASDPRGVAPTPKRPGTVPMELIVEDAVCESPDAAALGVPRIKVLLPSERIQQQTQDDAEEADGGDIAGGDTAGGDIAEGKMTGGRVEGAPGGKGGEIAASGAEEPEPSPEDAPADVDDENLEEQVQDQERKGKAKAFSLASCLEAFAAEAAFGGDDLVAWCADAARAETVVETPDFPAMLEWAFLENSTCRGDSELKPAMGNALPWVRALSNSRQDQAWSALRQLVKMAVHGLEVYWGRRSADEPRANQDFEGTAHALVTETIVALRLAVVRGANALAARPAGPLDEPLFNAAPTRPLVAVGRHPVHTVEELAEALAEEPTSCVAEQGEHELLLGRQERIRWDEAAQRAVLGPQTLSDVCVDAMNTALLGHLEQVWKNCCVLDRRDVETMRLRPRVVAKDVSKDPAFSTVLERHVSSHDISSRPHQPRDDGFVDGRDTTDTNPGQRAFMCLGATLSRRVPWDLLCSFADLVAETLQLSPEDSTNVALGRQKRLLVDGVPRFALQEHSMDEVEYVCRQALRGAASAGAPLLHEVSVELSHSGVNLNGLPDRLLRPVQLLRHEQGDASWAELLDNGVVKWLGQDEQASWQVTAEEPLDDLDLLEDREELRRAWELDTELRCGYRVVKVPQRQNGHPSRLHYFIKLAAKAAASGPLVPGKGRRFVGISNLSEGSVQADAYSLGGFDDNQEGVAMALAWGCAGGSNHEDSLAVPERTLRAGKLYKEVELVKWTREEPLRGDWAEHDVNTTAIGEDGLPRGKVLVGQPLAVFRKVKDGIGHGRKRTHGVLAHDLWNSPVDGVVVAARQFADRIEVVIRQPLPADEGSKLGFVFQKMTQAILRRPLVGTWMDVSAVSHPTSMLSRQSPALLLLGMRNLEAAGRCVSPGLRGGGTAAASLRQSQREGGDVFWNMVDCPDVPHHASGPVFDDATGRSRGRSLVVILRASQAAAHHPYAGVSGRCDDDGDGRGPRQEPLLRMLLSSLGYDTTTEEQSPAAVWSGCGHRLCTLAVCSECMTVTCPCTDRNETFLRVPEQLVVADGLARQQHLQLCYQEGEPVPVVGAEPRQHEGTPATSQELHRAAVEAAAPRRAPLGPGTLGFEEDEESGESTVKLSGRGARVVGMALLDRLQENAVAAVEDVEERGRGDPFEYVFRTLEPRRVQPGLEAILDATVQLAEETAGGTVTSGGIWMARLSRGPRLEANLMRLYARDLLPVKFFALDDDKGGFRSRVTGRLLPTPPLDVIPTGADLWREAHYESTALAEALAAVPLGAAIPPGRAEVVVPKATLHGMVRASDLRINGRPACACDVEVLPLPPNAGTSLLPVKVSGVVCELSPVEGAPFSALPYARVNSEWTVVADVTALRQHPKETARLLNGEVCHRGLLGNAAAVVQSAAGSVELAKERCDGCGACVHLADHMPTLVDIEDLSALARLEEAAHLPLRGALRLVENDTVTVLEACSGSDEPPRSVLVRAAAAVVSDWRPAATSDCDMIV